MPLFSFFKREPQPPRGSANFQAFWDNYLCEEASEERVRMGLNPGLIERLTPEERTEAERLLLQRLARGGDGRAPAGLASMGSQAAVEPLRQAMAAQAGHAAASPACALALWRLTRDPAAIQAVAAIASDSALHWTVRMEAVIALHEMPSATTQRVLTDVLHTSPEVLLRVHAFRGLLVLHGYSPQEADDLYRPSAPDIAGAHLRPAARQAMLARLSELLAGRMPAASA